MRLLCSLGLALSLLCPLAARADLDFQIESDPLRSDGLAGVHINRGPNDSFANGISFDVDNKFAWHTGLNITMDYSFPGVANTPPDLILAYSSLLRADNLRLRADDARMILGPRIGHPVHPFQFTIAASVPENPLGGLTIGTYGYQQSIQMFNRDPQIKRTLISFANLFAWGTDSPQNGAGDFFLHNFQTETKPIQVSPSNDIALNGNLGHNGAALGFYGAAPTTRPVVTGSLSDVSAPRSVLAALVQLGLVTDNTSP